MIGNMKMKRLDKLPQFLVLVMNYFHKEPKSLFKSNYAMQNSLNSFKILNKKSSFKIRFSIKIFNQVLRVDHKINKESDFQFSKTDTICFSMDGPWCCQINKK